MTVFNTNYSSIDEAYGFLNPQLNKLNKDPTCDLYASKKNESDLVTFANQYQVQKQAKPSNIDSHLLDHAYDFNKVNFQRQNNKSREHQMKDVTNNIIYDEVPKQSPNHNHKKYHEQLVTSEESFERNYDFQPSLIENLQPQPQPQPQNDNLQPQKQYADIHIENVNTNTNMNGNNTHKVCEFDEDTVLKLLSKKYMNEYTTHPISDERKPSQQINYIDLVLYIISGIILIFIMEQFVKIGMHI